MRVYCLGDGNQISGFIGFGFMEFERFGGGLGIQDGPGLGLLRLLQPRVGT